MHKQPITILAHSLTIEEYSQRKYVFLKMFLIPSCIDLFLINSALSFQNTLTVSCGLSDFHKLVMTQLRFLETNHVRQCIEIANTSILRILMRRSYLENFYFKKRTDKSLRAYKKQENYYSRLYKMERNKLFNKLNPSFVNDNKLLWKTVKPLFSNKGSSGSNIKLVEKDEVLQVIKKLLKN